MQGLWKVLTGLCSSVMVLAIILVIGATVITSRTGSENAFDNSNFELPIYFENFTIPTEKTRYMCRSVKPELLQKDDVHAISFEATVEQPQYVHHLILYSCGNATGLPSEEYFGCENITEGCEQFVWGWAPGVGPYDVPKETGFRFGVKGTQHFLLQIHYTNPNGVQNVTDNSGVKVTVTKDLRKTDAGVAVFGVPTRSISIPPQMPSYTISWNCTANRTMRLFPQTVTAIGSTPHAHTLGRKIKTEIFRNGVKIGDLGGQDPFDFGNQHMDPLNVAIVPGDVFTTTCVYDSTSRNTTTNGGLGTEDEMCLNFVPYYPSLGSSIFCF